MPNLLNPKFRVALERNGVGARADQLHILVLVVTPFAEVVLCRSDGEREEKNNAYRAKSPCAIAKQLVPETAESSLHLSSSKATPTPIRGHGRTCQLRLELSIQSGTRS